MIFHRTLLTISTLLGVIIASSVVLLSGGRFTQMLNGLLPSKWEIAIADGFSANWQRATLPPFSLSYQNCPVLTADKMQLQWVEPIGISLSQATLDYHCLSRLPSNDEPSTLSPKNIKNLLSLIPNGTIEIKRLGWTNLPEELSPRLKALLEQPSELQFAKKSQNLTACLRQETLDFCANVAELILSATLNYTPNSEEKHQVKLESRLDHLLFQLPQRLDLHYQFQLPQAMINNPALQQGEMRLTWQREGNDLKGHWQLYSSIQPENQIALPFTLDQQGLTVEQGRLHWQLNDQFILRGFVTSKITPNRSDFTQLFPIKTAIRLSLLSENEKGKGNVVINSPEGEWQRDNFNLPINIHGNLKQGNFILYSAVPLNLTGEYHNPTLRFLPSALLRLTGKEQFLQIHDLRFPLAGIRVNKQGINGRLQAIFLGESPDFKHIKLHLDGYANHFNAGLAFFDSTQSTPLHRWQWRFWGNTAFQALQSPITITGRGNWHQKSIQLSEFNGKLGKVKQPTLTIPYLALTLAKPITFEYETRDLAGELALTTPKIAFSYGGELESPSAQLNLNGKLDNLNLKGEITAGKLGPIRLFARRKLTETTSHLNGRLYWQEQPANAFQSLLPFRSNWLITQGTIRGETAFSANAESGLTAGGHFAIRQASLSLPNGELNGIDFSLPYQFQHNEVDIGMKHPLDVRIAEINLGIPLKNAKLKVQGHYPYSKKRPLFVRELSLELLGGTLNIDHFSLPQTRLAYLNLRQIEIEKVLALAQYHQLDLTGKLNATFPFWLTGKPCYICNGYFEQTKNAHLKFTPELLNAMKQSGYTEQLLTYLVNDSNIDQFTGNLHITNQGEMMLTSALKLHLTEQQRAKINLNYRHQENLFDLWKLINYGSQFEQNIEHHLYQQLDNK